MLRRPEAADAVCVWSLIKRCPPLDVNSSYAYLLLSHHFADTCVVAECGGAIVGFVSGYAPPSASQTLFVWQVAVDDRMRGQGLGHRMILDVLTRARRSPFTVLETTVSPSNTPSRRMFEKVAKSLNAALSESSLFRREHLGESDHEEEHLLTIGPFGRLGGNALEGIEA